MIDAGGFFARFPQGMTVRTRNRLITFSILAGPFIFFVSLLLFWDAEPLPPVPPLPNPNGYDAFVKAGETMRGDFEDFADLSADDLQKLISTNSEALKLVNLGMSEGCIVPNNYSPNYIDSLVDQLPAIKRLAWAMSAEGRLAELNKRTNDAVRIYLDTVQIGQKSSHGGVIIVRLVGTAIETIGMKPLGMLTNTSDLHLCREVLQKMETIDSTDDSAEATLQQERIWQKQAFGFWGQIRILLDYNDIKATNQRFFERLNETQKQRRALMINFAARAYELDKGHPPANVTDLMPDYLKAVPQDPFTGTNMVYSP
jgi:hypothetical protein